MSEKFSFQFPSHGDPQEIIVSLDSGEGIRVTRADNHGSVLHVRVPLQDAEDHESDTTPNLLAGIITGDIDNFLPRARWANEMIPFARALEKWIRERRAATRIRDHE